jgi:HEAT repeat protein
MFLVLANLQAQGPPKVLGKTTEEWLKILNTESNVKKKQAALIALKVFGPSESGVVDGLIRALQDKAPEVRLSAAQILGEMGEPAKTAVLRLGKVLSDDPSPRVKEAVAHALGDKLLPFSKPVIPLLGKALKEPDADVRVAAATTLKEHGKDARPVLADLLAALNNPDNDRFTRSFAAQTLIQLKEDGGKIIPAFTAILPQKGADPALKQVVVDGLARFGKEASAAADTLEQLFKDSKAPVLLRRSAAVTLAQIGPDGKKLWPTVKMMMKAKEKELREQAIRLAGRVCRGEPELVNALKACVDDRHLEARVAAIQELGELGPAAKGAESTLAVVARNDPRFSVREAAEAALKKIRGEK